jgi:ABC-type transport system involved in multi-copper enzyme maturation permease subunit
VTATMTPPYRSAVQPGRDGFLQLLRTEWTKFRSVRGWVVGVVAASVAIVLVGLLAGAANHLPQGGPGALPVGPGGEAVKDSFFFVHQPLSGDGSITVPVNSLTDVIRTPEGNRAGGQPWAKAGLILKDGTDPGSAYAAVMLTLGQGVRMQYDFTHDHAGTATAGTGTPRWLRLTRSGETVTGYESADGVTWTQVGPAARLAGLPQTAEVGLFVSSPEAIQTASQQLGGGGTIDPTVATAEFGRVVPAGDWQLGDWDGYQVGPSFASYPSDTVGGVTETAQGLTVTGAGDIAPAVGGPALGPGQTIENFLIGAFAGLIVVMVVGATFITAEYRRGLIRSTLTVSPRRGRMLLAKAVVIGAVSFAAGLVAALIAVPLGRGLAESNGFFVFPVSAATQVRVIVGTAALLGIAAVFALAVGAVLRHSAGAIAFVIAVIILPYTLSTSSVLPPGPSEWLLRLTPAAAFSVQQSIPKYDQVISIYTPANGYYPLPPWGGLAVLLGYTLAALLLAVVLLRRRDA